VIRWAEEECLYEQNGEAVLRDANIDECCVSGTCGVEFGCF
jgi:hypothetical protein